MDLEPMYRGDGRSFVVALTHEDSPWPVPPGAAVRCTGKVRVHAPDDDAQFAKTLGAGITVDGANVTVTLDPADTSGLTVDTDLQCDIQVTPTSGIPVTVSRFVLPVRLDISVTVP